MAAAKQEALMQKYFQRGVGRQFQAIWLAGCFIASATVAMLMQLHLETELCMDCLQRWSQGLRCCPK